jgi:hypothetical protein
MTDPNRCADRYQHLAHLEPMGFAETSDYCPGRSALVVDVPARRARPEPARATTRAS